MFPGSGERLLFHQWLRLYIFMQQGVRFLSKASFEISIILGSVLPSCQAIQELQGVKYLGRALRLDAQSAAAWPSLAGGCWVTRFVESSACLGAGTWESRG